MPMLPLVPPTILARLREQQPRLMQSVGFITRFLEVADGASFIREESPIGETRCNVTPLGQEQAAMVAERFETAATHSVRVPFDTNIYTKDRLTVGGRAFDILGVADARSDALYLECYAGQVNA